MIKRNFNQIIRRKNFFQLIEDTAQQTKASFALHAFVNKIALDEKNKASFIKLLAGQIKKAKSEYASILFTEELKLLSNKNKVQNSLNSLPLSYELPSKAFTKNLNSTQQLLFLQEQMDKANSPITKKYTMWQVAKLSGIAPFMFVAKYLDDNTVKNSAALLLTKLALNDSSINGSEVHAILLKAMPLIQDEDSAILLPALKALLLKMPNNGYVSLFNGVDLTGWKGLVANPIARSKMNDSALQTAQIKADLKMRADWVVKDGLLNFTGNPHGENLATIKKYGDIDMYVDWRIQSKGDAGVYLRGTPQVQIWDTSRREVGAEVGSGGLYNNQKNQSKPLLVADNAVGSWNTFNIIMKGDRVTVYLNGLLVTNNIPLENYWDRNLPLFTKEQIELQAHGTFVSYRNIYLKEL
jgi:hypothetical protein